MTKLPFLLLLFSFATLLHHTAAEIKTQKITSSRRDLFFFDVFGFTNTGHTNISISSAFVISSSSSSSSTPPDPSKLGFFFATKKSFIQAITDVQENSSASTCILNSKFIHLLFTFSSLPPPPSSSFNFSSPIHSPGEYVLVFANCDEHSKVSMDVRTELYNLDGGGHFGNKDYLSVGFTLLPGLYFMFSLVYVLFLGVWFYVCLRNKDSVYRIHVIMGVLLVMKFLNLLFAAEDKHYVKVSGTAHGWDVLFYLFQGIRVCLLFTVIVLIGTGWSFLKPFLQEREKKVLLVVIPFQVLANVVSAVIEDGPFGRLFGYFITWSMLFLAIDVVCCVVIILPIVWSIRALRESSKTDGKAARNLAKLTLFRRFYFVVVGYLYFTRIVVFVLRYTAAYRYHWVAYAAEEMASLAFYVVMFYMFQPAERNHYFVLDDEEEEAAEMTLRDEEFDL